MNEQGYPAEMSFEEKIANIIREYPAYGAYKIKKELNSAKYGFMKISWFAVRSELNKLDLKSKTKRYNFATQRTR